MHRHTRRRIAWGVLSLAALASAVPASGAFDGSITLTDPVKSSAIRKTKAVEWSWKRGTDVKSTSKVDVHVVRPGILWTPLALGTPIRDGSTPWKTTKWPDGVYAVRARVAGTSIRSYVTSVTVDNTAPAVEIRSPREGDVIVDGQQVTSFAVVAGTATMVAQASDALSGVATVRWFLDDTEIAQGAQASYNFGVNPGQHVLEAVAYDRAGNSASHAIDVLALPGPSTLGETPQTTPPPAPDPGALPVPSETPSVPPAPETPVPSETPSVPDPGPLPVPTESPAVPPVPEPPPIPIP